MNGVKNNQKNCNFVSMFRILYRYLIIILVLIAVSPAVMSADTKKFTVVIDAGHGGKDVGATDNGVMEKNINLKVAKQLESLIKKKMKNTNVVMTREGDNYLTLQQRADKANKAQGDLFISIHTNSVDKKNRNSKNVAGSSVYTLGLHKDDNNLAVAMRENSVIELENDYQQKYSGFDPQRDESYIIFEMAQKKNMSRSIYFAEDVEKELVKSGRQNRGVHQAGFWVLWATSMPAVLVELDFICNPNSAKYMASDKGAKELAEAIFKAIQKYEASWSKSINGTSSELTDVYFEDDDSNLEDTYTITTPTAYTKAKTKTLKTATPPVRSDKRKRRSARSKELSLNQSFEKDNLVYPESRSYAVAESSNQKAEELLAINENSPVNEKSKAKDKKAEKKKQKEDKKRAQEAKKQEAKKRKEDAHNAKLNKLVTVYKIQVLASADLLNQSNSRFCGLSPITTYKENNLYKYYYGESTDKAEMESMLSDVRKKIPDAFIVSSQKTVQTK